MKSYPLLAIVLLLALSAPAKADHDNTLAVEIRIEDGVDNTGFHGYAVVIQYHPLLSLDETKTGAVAGSRNYDLCYKQAADGSTATNVRFVNVNFTAPSEATAILHQAYDLVNGVGRGSLASYNRRDINTGSFPLPRDEAMAVSFSVQFERTETDAAGDTSVTHADLDCEIDIVNTPAPPLDTFTLADTGPYDAAALAPLSAAGHGTARYFRLPEPMRPSISNADARLNPANNAVQITWDRSPIEQVNNIAARGSFLYTVNRRELDSNSDPIIPSGTERTNGFVAIFSTSFVDNLPGRPDSLVVIDTTTGDPIRKIFQYRISVINSWGASTPVDTRLSSNEGRNYKPDFRTNFPLGITRFLVTRAGLPVAATPTGGYDLLAKTAEPLQTYTLAAEIANTIDFVRYGYEWETVPNTVLLSLTETLDIVAPIIESNGIAIARTYVLALRDPGSSVTISKRIVLRFHPVLTPPENLMFTLNEGALEFAWDPLSGATPDDAPPDVIYQLQTNRPPPTPTPTPPDGTSLPPIPHSP